MNERSATLLLERSRRVIMADSGAQAQEEARAGMLGAELDRELLIANGVVGFEHLDVRSRTFAMLRTQLLNGFYRGGGRVLAVTSTQPGNGKTYVTANLAAALSRIHPTILVDLDLRRPAIAQRFGVPVRRGVDDYLSGEASFASTGIAVRDTALTIHGVRMPRGNSAALLGEERLATLFAGIRRMPDAPICVVDTPPALVLDDIMLIARAVDGVLMIVEEGRTRARDLEEAVRLLAPAPIVGSVLNKSMGGGASRDPGGYYDVES